jgi:hypothetical protein
VHDDEGECLAKVRSAHAAGFEVRGFFLLPGSVWWGEYYRHLDTALSEATAAHPPFKLMKLREEVARFKSQPQGYGSAYFILRRRDVV